MLPFNLPGFLAVSSILFGLGLYTVLTRRNAISILMGIELILNAAGLNLVAFTRFLRPAPEFQLLGGQVFALFVIVVAAAEVAAALAIVLCLYARVKTIDVEQFRDLHG